MAREPFRGTYTVLITPFTADGAAVDYKALERLVEYQITEGVKGLIPLGSTGEFLSVSREERQGIVETVVRAARARRHSGSSTRPAGSGTCLGLAAPSGISPGGLAAGAAHHHPATRQFGEWLAENHVSRERDQHGRIAPADTDPDPGTLSGTGIIHGGGDLLSGHDNGLGFCATAPGEALWARLWN